jgi:hypothetical protein
MSTYARTRRSTWSTKPPQLPARFQSKSRVDDPPPSHACPCCPQLRCGVFDPPCHVIVPRSRAAGRSGCASKTCTRRTAGYGSFLQAWGDKLSIGVELAPRSACTIACRSTRHGGDDADRLRDLSFWLAQKLNHARGRYPDVRLCHAATALRIWFEVVSASVLFHASRLGASRPFPVGRGQNVGRRWAVALSNADLRNRNCAFLHP